MEPLHRTSLLNQTLPNSQAGSQRRVPTLLSSLCPPASPPRAGDSGATQTLALPPTSLPPPRLAAAGECRREARAALRDGGGEASPPDLAARAESAREAAPSPPSFYLLPVVAGVRRHASRTEHGRI